MPSFDGDNLFASGPTRFHIGGRALRHTLQTPIDADGAALRSEGRSARFIKQTGTLTADSMVGLAALGDAIEAKLNGLPATLIDGDGVSHENTVMIRFNPGPARRLGPRWCVDYRIEYVQASPHPSESWT